jgi:hypothetical protein
MQQQDIPSRRAVFRTPSHQYLVQHGIDHARSFCWYKQLAAATVGCPCVGPQPPHTSIVKSAFLVSGAEDGLSLRRMAERLPPLETETEVAAPLVARKGVDYARRAANRRALWGDYEDDEPQEQWEG